MASIHSILWGVRNVSAFVFGFLSTGTQIPFLNCNGRHVCIVFVVFARLLIVVE